MKSTAVISLALVLATGACSQQPSESSNGGGSTPSAPATSTTSDGAIVDQILAREDNYANRAIFCAAATQALLDDANAESYFMKMSGKNGKSELLTLNALGGPYASYAIDQISEKLPPNFDQSVVKSVISDKFGIYKESAEKCINNGQCQAVNLYPNEISGGIFKQNHDLRGDSLSRDAFSLYKNFYSFILSPICSPVLTRISENQHNNK